MTQKNLSRILLRLLAGSAFLFAGVAHAQYAWVDAQGVHHYSDRPPPPGTPASKILKAPREAGFSLAPPAADAPAADAPTPQAAPTLAEREADFRKRAKEREKQDQKAALEAQRKAAQATNCENAQRYKSELESGIRVATTGADGERAFISDEERARRLADTNATLRDCR